MYGIFSLSANLGVSSPKASSTSCCKRFWSSGLFVKIATNEYVALKVVPVPEKMYKTLILMEKLLLTEGDASMLSIVIFPNWK